MSHEIRTPLNGIGPVLEMMKNSGLTVDQKQYADIAVSSAQLLVEIIK